MHVYMYKISNVIMQAGFYVVHNMIRNQYTKAQIKLLLDFLSLDDLWDGIDE